MNTKTKHWASITAGILSLAGYASATSLGSEKYTYDASGNIVEKSIDGQVTKLSYDASNKITSIDFAANGREQVSYDDAGRPVSYNDESGQSIRKCNYGYADKILRMGDAIGKAEFFYNAEGQFIGKAVAGKFTQYSWDGNVVASVGSEAFANEDHFTGGVPILTEGGDVVVSDYLGSTLAMGEKSAVGTAYGEGLQDVRFTGKPFVKELDGFVFPCRLYSPAANQWATADPSGFPDGANNHTYVSGDPLGKVDPSGLKQGYVACQVSNNGNSLGTINVYYNYDKNQTPDYDRAQNTSSTTPGGGTLQNPSGSIPTKGTETPETGDTSGRRFFYKELKATGGADYKISNNAQPVWVHEDNVISNSGAYEK